MTIKTENLLTVEVFDMEKKRVAVVLHGLGANGIDTLFANLSGKWDLEKFDMTYFIAIDEGDVQFWENRVVENGVKVVHLHDLDLKQLPKWPFTLYKALKKYGPFDVVHMNMDMLNGINLFVAKKAGIPERLCHAHRASSENAASKLKQTYVAAMLKMVKKYATGFIACSDNSGQYFFPGLDFYTVINGIDIEKYRNKENKNREKHNNFITVGRFSPQKNPIFLCEVFAEISKRLPDAHLKWVGSGGLLEEAQKKADELGVSDKIDFMGIRSDVNELLKESDYFLLPSVFEGLSLALAEAQAADLDCFVSDTVSRMSDCGKCMFIPLEKSAGEWADEITAYINGSYRMTADPELLAKFDVERMARTLEKIYCKDY